MHFHKPSDKDAAIYEFYNDKSDIHDYAESLMREHWRCQYIDERSSAEQEYEEREGKEGDHF